MLWADTFDLLLREFVTGHLPAVGIPDRPAPAGLRWRAAFAPWSGSRLSQLAKGLALDIPDLSARTGWSDEGYAPSSGSEKLVMNAFYEHHNDSIRFGYRCFDRILLNGLIQPFQQPERVVGFFNSYRQLYPVGRDVLRGAAEQFQTWVKEQADRWAAPIVEAPKGRRDEFVEPYFKRARPDQVVVILKAREPARIMTAVGDQALTVAAPTPRGDAIAIIGRWQRQPARRELEEEIGLTATALVPAGCTCTSCEGRPDRVHFFELQLVELPKLRLDNREIIEARLTSPVELQNMVPTILVAAYLARRQSLGWHPDPT